VKNSRLKIKNEKVAYKKYTLPYQNFIDLQITDYHLDKTKFNFSVGFANPPLWKNGVLA